MHWGEDDAVQIRPNMPELTFGECWCMSLHIKSCREPRIHRTEVWGNINLWQKGSVRGHKTEILFRCVSEANKSNLRGFAGLCTLTVQTANGTAASGHPTGHKKQMTLETVWDKSRAGEGGKLNVHWIVREEVSKWQQASMWFRGLCDPFYKDHDRNTLSKEESCLLFILRQLVYI